MSKEWTFDLPTKEGYYWIEDGIRSFQIVKIKRNLFDKEKLTVTFFQSGDHVDPIHMKGTKWSGPIESPPTDTIKEKKEEINEKSDS